MLDIKGNKRLKKESFINYKNRLKIENNRLRKFLSGRIIWDSSKLGTYIKTEVDNA